MIVKEAIGIGRDIRWKCLDVGNLKFTIRCGCVVDWWENSNWTVQASYPHALTYWGSSSGSEFSIVVKWKPLQQAFLHSAAKCWSFTNAFAGETTIVSFRYHNVGYCPPSKTEANVIGQWASQRQYRVAVCLTHIYTVRRCRVAISNEKCKT